MRSPQVVLVLGSALLIQPGAFARDPGAATRHLESINWAPYQQQAVRLLQEYLRIDTSNPPGNELAAALFFKRFFDEARIENRLFEYAPGRANLYARLRGDGAQRPLVLLSHTDVVRAEPRVWRAPPFSGDIVNAEIYGRGALDMKGEGIVQAMVMLVAAEKRLPLKRDLIFLAVADEEVGNSGSAWILEHQRDLVRNAEFLITEGGSNLIYPGRGTVYGIGVAEKAPYWLRMTATGRGGHGSVPHARSAVHRLARAMQRVADWETPIRLLPAVEEYFRAMAALETEPRASQFRNVREALRDAQFAHEISEEENLSYMLRNTISLTVLRAGEQTNVIPDLASCDLDIRLLPGENPEAFLNELRTVVADDRMHFELLNQFKPPNASPTGTTLYRVLEETIRQNNPAAIVAPTLNSGYTESQMFREAGIHCYGFAPFELTPELDATQHAANERIPVEQVRRGVKLLYEIVARAASE
jgi:acetylornithine deacetylase/succinyl-diaminopimelate desuccinylase-like protein